MKARLGAGLWEESFKAHRDSKPNGPTSVGVDVSWPGAGTRPHALQAPRAAAGRCRSASAGRRVAWLEA
jgi:hypothetical protein